MPYSVSSKKERGYSKCVDTCLVFVAVEIRMQRGSVRSKSVCWWLTSEQAESVSANCLGLPLSSISHHHDIHEQAYRSHRTSCPSSSESRAAKHPTVTTLDIHDYGKAI